SNSQAAPYSTAPMPEHNARMTAPTRTSSGSIRQRSATPAHTPAILPWSVARSRSRPCMGTILPGPRGATNKGSPRKGPVRGRHGWWVVVGRTTLVPIMQDDSADTPEPADARDGDVATPTTPAHPRAVRVSDGAWLGGVCSGMAAHLGVPVLVFRLGF